MRRTLLAPLLTLAVGATDVCAYQFNDVHFHLTNYIQQGTSLADFLDIMGERVERVSLFGIPLQQKWDYHVSGERAPDYYLLSDASLYYYSYVDTIIADAYLGLSPADQQRFDPMITGFNPTDMYAAQHIRRVLMTYPGVFSGVGEFTIHKEFVSAKISGHTASLRNPAVDSILEFVAEAGLVAIIHNDINTIRPAPGGRPAHFDDLKALLGRHPGATVIWAHTGLGRILSPTDDHLALLREILEDPALAHVSFDISWDEVAKWATRDAATVNAWAALISEYPQRFIFGTDSVAPSSWDAYAKTYRDYQPLWDKLDERTSELVRRGNYARIFDTANASVRAWELTQFTNMDDAVPVRNWPFAQRKAEVEAQLQ